MLPKERIIVGLEVGTSKVCAVVGEVLDDGNIMVIGVGQANSEGVRKGEIINIDAAVEGIHAAVADAEGGVGWGAGCGVGAAWAGVGAGAGAGATTAATSGPTPTKPKRHSPGTRNEVNGVPAKMLVPIPSR